jgi:ornithine--oxo-acid transaminase
MTLTEDYIRKDKTYGAHNYNPLPVVLSKAEGPWV